jgi:hypothetical protein
MLAAGDDAAAKEFLEVAITEELTNSAPGRDGPSLEGHARPFASLSFSMEVKLS